MDAHQAVAAYWAAAEARDWATFTDLVAENVVYEAPQTRERVRGRAAYARFNMEGFRTDWHLEVERIVGEGRHAASWIQFSDAGDRYPGVCFFDSMRTAGLPGLPISGPLRLSSRPAARTWWSVTERMPGPMPRT
jgi:SnoaL-like domain